MCVSNIHRQSIFHRSARNPVIYSSIRTSLLDRTPEKPEHLSNALRDIENAAAFLRADRNYKVCPSWYPRQKITYISQILLERYSPLHDLSEEERIKATARRVGLNTPKEYKP